MIVNGFHCPTAPIKCFGHLQSLASKYLIRQRFCFPDLYKKQATEMTHIFNNLFTAWIWKIFLSHKLLSYNRLDEAKLYVLKHTRLLVKPDSF